MKKACAVPLLSLLTLSLFSSCGPQDALLTTDDSALAQSPLTGPMPFRGVNLAGAEFGVASDGTGGNPGTFGTTYTWPDAAYASGYNSPAYFISRGMTLFRLPFRWERLQPTRNAPFNAAELARLRTTVTNLTNQGASVLLDPHNYARYGTAFIGSASVPHADFADFWARLANEFKANPRVIFGLINEPYGLPTEQWVTSANAAIVAIRAAGATNLVIVPGNAWSGAHSWDQNWYGTPNSVALLAIQDSGNNVAFEAHQYLDSNASGSTNSCAGTTVGSQRMQPFTNWLRAHGKKGFLGEFAAGNGATCLAALDDLLSHLDANSDVYLGWTYWAAGPWWGNAWTSLEPVGGQDTAQMTVLRAHLNSLPAAPTCTDGVKNGTETGVDCGGSCPACAPVPTCSDGVKNGTETGVDCGGSCPACAPAPTCSDGVKNGTETGVDCGGSCPACAPVPTCTDGVKNGTETGVDCGGSCAACTVPPGTCQVSTYEAEAAYHSTGGPVTDGWNLYSNGYLETASHAFPSGATTLTVTARGTPVNRVGPLMTVSVGGVTLGSVTVSATKWTGYAFTVPAGANGKIRVAFSNDARTSTEDRNLYVDQISTAPCPQVCSASTYEAEAMFHSTGGATTGGWNLWSNGYASTTHTFAAGVAALTITARGSPAGGVWPQLRVSVGGVLVGTVTVSSSGWQAYPVSFTATAGAQELRLAFDNDAIIGSEDRNLYLDQVTVGCPSP